MPIRFTQFSGPATISALALASILCTVSVPALAAKSAIQQECSAKYKAAKSANTLNGQTYNQFYKQCSADAKAAAATPAATPAPTEPPAAAPPAAPPAAKPAPAKPAPAKAAAAEPPPPANVKLPPPAPAAAGSPVFPSGISPSLVSEKPGKQRFDTCLAQYHANKANGGNAGLTWIGKGQYYSLCNTKLKS